MNHNQAWQRLFPAVLPESQRIFLNNRHGTQIPESIIQNLAHSLNAGIDWNNDHGTAELRQKLAAFLHVDAPEAFLFSASETGLLHWLAYSWCSAQLQDGDEVILSPQDDPMIKETFE